MDGERKERKRKIILILNVPVVLNTILYAKIPNLLAVKWKLQLVWYV